uniref:Uncharacterized protein n=1 Tax=Fundulus heteroclitus TaxID=8078 RepID=A0A3Q2PSF6_FUNHE
MGDIQGDLPVVRCLLDLRHPAAHLPGHGPGLLGHHMAGVVHHVGWPHVPRPVGGGECGEVLKHRREAKCLVKDAAGVVQVSEWVPAVGPLHGEGNMSLGHAGCGQLIGFSKLSLGVSVCVNGCLSCLSLC